jgi:hypothetical protein
MTSCLLGFTDYGSQYTYQSLKLTVHSFVSDLISPLDTADLDPATNTS